MSEALAAPPFAVLLVPAFTLWGSPVTWLEIVAFVLSIAMVLCNFRVNPWAWPLAIVSSALYSVLFASSRLYGEASLQLLFITVAFWGWWQWLRGHGADGAPLRVHVLSMPARWQIGALTLAAWPVLGWLLDRHTDSDVPYLDALPTVGSVAGQLLLGRKLVENWPVWLVVNAVSLALFAVKGLWLTVVLYALFALLSLVGWRAWHRLRLGSA
ncbi:MAG TPA: nicotinamide riboside transporter PnuC [Burkholderiaceae bacterium]|nr:nicotinamide riboside transporter PnuC [Burkholderiaceae bacterium]